MPELLLELGTEELPASAVRKAYEDLQTALIIGLREAGVLEGESIAMGTPRRLIVTFPDLLARQADQTKEQRGPSVSAAFDAEGNPSKALQGFCRSQGVEPADLRNDGEYVWANKLTVGRPTSDLLSELIPKAIRSLTFGKTMRWGSSRMRFARPIRWIVALFDGEIVPFQIETVSSANQSRGHRFYAPEPFDVKSFENLLSGLRTRMVEPDAAVRRETIVSQIKLVAEGEPTMPDSLIEENVFLTEWPTAISGSFRNEFLELPESVLVTAMAKHEKMFPITRSGRLVDRFVFIRNSGEDETVRQGAEWVLNARFNDAKFFFDEDKKHGLDNFLEKTTGILFQEKLGNVRQRADRLAELAQRIAETTGATVEEIQWAATAGLYAKADLSTGLVSELASLQGIIGGEYARREGLPEPVCEAIATQYDVGKAKSKTALTLIIADQLDKLAGYLGIGLEPTGSSDPFALRRAANILVEAAWQWPGSIPSYAVLYQYAQQPYGTESMEAFSELMAGRYPALLPNVRYDLLEAALRDRTPKWVCAPCAVKFRLQCLERLADDVPFVQTATRPINIVAAAAKKGEAIGNGIADVQIADLDSADGERLHAALIERVPRLLSALSSDNVEEVVTNLTELAAPINAFFDSTMVMADVPRVRYARLTLLEAVRQELMAAGDWSKIVIEG
jgi:glycyl-tRNA synthetase beta chain